MSKSKFFSNEKIDISEKKEETTEKEIERIVSLVLNRVDREGKFEQKTDNIETRMLHIKMEQEESGSCSFQRVTEEKNERTGHTYLYVDVSYAGTKEIVPSKTEHYVFHIDNKTQKIIRSVPPFFEEKEIKILEAIGKAKLISKEEWEKNNKEMREKNLKNQRDEGVY